MNIETKKDLIEEILATWKDRIGDDYPGYKGHVYRMLNFCLALHSCTEEEKSKLAIAACFHDIGLWSAHTVDYIPPSVFEVKSYLPETGRQEWSEEIGLMVEMHHKVRTYKTDRYPLVELFRKGDLVDFSLGFFKFCIPPGPHQLPLVLHVDVRALDLHRPAPDLGIARVHHLDTLQDSQAPVHVEAEIRHGRRPDRPEELHPRRDHEARQDARRPLLPAVPDSLDVQRRVVLLDLVHVLEIQALQRTRLEVDERCGRLAVVVIAVVAEVDDAPADLPPQTQLTPKYVIERRLGKPGSFAVAYKVIDTLGDVSRVVKLVLRDRGSTVDRLKKEYKTLLQIPDHPNV